MADNNLYVNETLQKIMKNADDKMEQQILRQGKLGTTGEVEIVVEYSTTILGFM